MRFCFFKKDFVEKEIDPLKKAVIDSQRSLTWAGFDMEVNALCDFFRKNSWDTPSNPVIIFGHKPAEMIVSVYAMMKLGITYIPLDEIYPRTRIEKIREISGSQLVINCSGNPLGLEDCTEVLLGKNGCEIVKETKIQCNSSASDDPLIYIIFTSGSTGDPKGVQISTEAIRSFTHWLTSDFGFSSGDVFINTAVLSFDLSVYELMTFGALGATLLLCDKSVTENTELFIDRVRQHQGTVWVSTPSFALAFTRLGPHPGLSSLKFFLFCGETLPHATAKNLLKNFGHASVYNSYGPTEATVATTLVPITPQILERWDPLPVGFPRPGSSILIDKENEHEREGEILISGDHVSTGYFRNDELNRQKFFIHNGKRAFRTGDLGYFSEGLLFYSGRNDDQVKLHGFRIELDEINSALRKHDDVSDAVTVGLKRNNTVKKLVSFVIAQQKADKNKLKGELTAFLKERLPYYMIPGDMDVVDAFPYSANHKVDKKKLADGYLQKQLGETGKNQMT